MKKVFEILISDTGTILISLVCGAISVYALFFIVGTELDPNRNKNWWSLAFESRSLETNNFIIENHSDSDMFRYEVITDGKTVAADTLHIANGEEKTISIDTTDAKTIEITATDHTGKKQSIYRKK